MFRAHCHLRFPDVAQVVKKDVAKWGANEREGRRGEVFKLGGRGDNNDICMHLQVNCQKMNLTETPGICSLSGPLNIIDIPLVQGYLRMYLWWSLGALCLVARCVRVTVGDSGFCCVCVTSLVR